MCLRAFIGESCSPRVLSLLFQAINFHFNQTTKHRPTRNLHSSTQLFAVTSTASTVTHIFPPRAIKYHKIHEYSRGKWPNYFVVFDHFHGKFVGFITKLLICLKFFAYCGFPNNFIDVVHVSEQLS